MNIEKKKQIAIKYGSIISCIYRILFPSWIIIKGNKNKVCCKGAFLKNNKITIKGNNNVIFIEPTLTRINNCTISINGSNCRIFIGAGANINKTLFYIQDDSGSIQIDRHVSISGRTNLSVIEGCKITIGERSLFSDEIDIRVGDSHSILDNKEGIRINPSKNIIIGEHVWVGHKVSILKGTELGNNSIVATGAILSNKIFPSNVIVGGIGGSILKDNISWHHDRIPMKK